METHIRMHPSTNNILTLLINTAQKMKFSIKDFFSKCGQIRRKYNILFQITKSTNLRFSLYIDSITTLSDISENFC